MALTTTSKDTRVLSNLVCSEVDNIFKKGVRFYKSGIGAIGIVPKNAVQNDLFRIAVKLNHYLTKE